MNNKLQDNQQEENPMRADEVRRMLGVGRNTLYSWCEQDLIPHKRIGRVILFPPRKRLLEWLEDKEDERG